MRREDAVQARDADVALLRDARAEEARRDRRLLGHRAVARPCADHRDEALLRGKVVDHRGARARVDVDARS